MSKRLPHGLVKALVAEAHEKGMTVPEAVRAYGLNRYSVYRAAKRMGIVFKSANPKPVHA